MKEPKSNSTPRPTSEPTPEVASSTSEGEPVEPYDQDGLRSIHNHEFMSDPRFQRAYQRGIQAVGTDYQWHWRVHVGLWAARLAAVLEGDFVECGVNRGFMSSAILEDLPWVALGKKFYLLDTFRGIDERYVRQDELDGGILDKNQHLLQTGFYTTDAAEVRRNFATWPNIIIIEGTIPETLDQIDAERVAFLHLDMNCSPPEVAAAEFLWDRLVSGAVVLMDDYAYYGYRPQKLGMDGFAREKGADILSLPTGQGLLIKAR
jgi:hypothetical protein